MTPTQFANQFCANAKTGGCAGLGINDRLETYRLWPPKPICTVGQERCPYFETTVAPHVRLLEAGPFRGSILEACMIYIRRLPQEERRTAKINIFGKAPDSVLEGLAPSRKCPSCGKPLEARRRLCEPCSIAARREAARVSMKNKRSSVNS